MHAPYGCVTTLKSASDHAQQRSQHLARSVAGDAGVIERQRAIHENRRLMYAFLSRMFEREVTLDLLKELSDKKNPILDAASLEGFDDEKLRKGYELVGGYLRSAADRDLNKVKLELAVEYANLFLGVKKKPAHPSESVYVSESQSMYQEPRDRALFTYWEAGVDKKKEYTEPEDHIAIELQFMEYLCRRVVESVQKLDTGEAVRFLKISQGFLRDHLCVWVPRLAKDIYESAEIDFYKGVATMTDAFTAIDSRAVAASLDELRETLLK